MSVIKGKPVCLRHSDETQRDTGPSGGKLRVRCELLLCVAGVSRTYVEASPLFRWRNGGLIQGDMYTGHDKNKRSIYYGALQR